VGAWTRAGTLRRGTPPKTEAQMWSCDACDWPLKLKFSAWILPSYQNSRYTGIRSAVSRVPFLLKKSSPFLASFSPSPRASVVDTLTTPLRFCRFQSPRVRQRPAHLRTSVFAQSASCRVHQVHQATASVEIAIKMADFSNYGGSEEENAEIKKLNAEVVGLALLYPSTGGLGISLSNNILHSAGGRSRQLRDLGKARLSLPEY
jgi:hypothetical protein